MDGRGLRIVGHSFFALLALAALPVMAESPPPPGPPGPPPGGDGSRPPFKRFMSEQFPGPGEASELRAEKMMQLACTPTDKLEKACEKWPKWQDMTPEKRKAFLGQIQDFRQNMRRFALSEATRMKLSVPPEREEEYIKAFWAKRIEVEKTLHKEMEPRRKELMDAAELSLQKEFPPRPELPKVSSKTD